MTMSVARALAEAWALWRRDRDVLVRLAVPFLFLPDYAMKLLLPMPMPVPAEAARLSLSAALQAQAQFVGDHLAAYLLEAVVVQFGLATLFALYAPVADVGAALRRGAWLWPRLMLAGVLVGVPGTLGLLLVVPGLLVFGRALLTGPLLAGEPATGAVAAIVRSVQMTRGSTVAVSVLAGAAFALRFAAAPFEQMDVWLRGLHAANPVPLAVIDAAGAGASALTQIAGVLIAVAAYRGLASKGV